MPDEYVVQHTFYRLIDTSLIVRSSTGLSLILRSDRKIFNRPPALTDFKAWRTSLWARRPADRFLILLDGSRPNRERLLSRFSTDFPIDVGLSLCGNSTVVPYCLNVDCLVHTEYFEIVS